MAIPKPRLVIADNRFIYKRYSFHMDNRFNFHNREKHMTKLLDLFQCKQFHPCAYTGGHSILYAIRFTLPSIIEKPNSYIQDNFFDDSGKGVAASGFFHWLPVSKDNHNDKYFAKGLRTDDLTQEAYDKGVNYEDGYTIVDLMFITELENIKDEVEAINSDLNEFVRLGLATKWEQIPFFPGK
jgi:hypothetical protein